MLAAEGAVLLLEKVSPALEHVDSSSGAIGTAVNRAIAALVEIIASAPADRPTRDHWLARLFAAHAEDQIPYIERVADHWGELCASPDAASRWADQLLETTRMALSPDIETRGHFHGTAACLSALYTAERYDDLVDLLEAERFWPYRRWAVKALAAQGKKAEAVLSAERCRDQGGDLVVLDLPLTGSAKRSCSPQVSSTKPTRDMGSGRIAPAPTSHGSARWHGRIRTRDPQRFSTISSPKPPARRVSGLPRRRTPGS